MNDYRRRLLFGFAAAFAGMLTSLAIDVCIPFLVPNRPVSSDLLFSLLPRIDWFEYLADGAALLAYVVFVWYVVRHDRLHAPRYLVGLGLLYGLRGLLLPLTPMGNPLGEGVQSGFLTTLGINGYFPSGHIGSSFLFFLFIHQKTAPLLKVLSGLIVLVIAVSLLLARGHYSIDIAGGLLLAYGIEAFLRRHMAEAVPLG